jgi:GNAT superfamily N-acetyltransferase
VTVTFELVDPDGPEAAAAKAAYFAELDERFPDGFDPTAGASPETEAAGTFVVVRDDELVVGCGALVAHDADTAEIKRMWIDPAWRGRGLGARLLAHLEQLASVQDHSRVVLDTNGTLTEAIAMYERNGYEPIERYNDNPYAQRWFAKTLPARRK